MSKLYVVGIGPGSRENMTLRALAALEDADIIVGYSVYTDLIRPMLPEKEYLETPMRKEADRCRMAIDIALAGRNVAMVSSGDAGVYGMASLMFEVGEEFPEIPVRVIPGVTAALSGAALLGAPLGHDFCVISLSDRLTDWELIEKRLRMAAAGDFVICLYNPASRHRADYLQKACDILLERKSPETLCGVARNIGREGESVRLCVYPLEGKLYKHKKPLFLRFYPLEG